MREVYEFLKKCGVYYLATVEGDRPRVRPFGALDVFEDRLYFQTGKIKPVARQLKVNPMCELCAFDPESGAWIRIAAEAVLDERIEAQTHMLDANPGLRSRYAPGDGNTEVYYLKNARAEISSFTAGNKVIEF